MRTPDHQAGNRRYQGSPVEYGFPGGEVHNREEEPWSLGRQKMTQEMTVPKLSALPGFP